MNLKQVVPCHDHRVRKRLGNPLSLPHASTIYSKRASYLQEMSQNLLDPWGFEAPRHRCAWQGLLFDDPTSADATSISFKTERYVI